MAKLSILLIVMFWLIGAFSSYVFPWYVHALALLAVGVLLVKLLGAQKEKSVKRAQLGRLPDDERYTI